VRRKQRAVWRALGEEGAAWRQPAVRERRTERELASGVGVERGERLRWEDLIALGKEKEGAAAKPPEEVLVGVRVSVEVGCRLAGWALPGLAGGRTLPFFLLKRFPFYYFLVFF
jgi:hypothetical protein